MGCCVCSKDRIDNLEVTISKIMLINSNPEFIDISLLTEDENQDKVRDWRFFRYTVFRNSESSSEGTSTFIQSDRKIGVHCRSDSIFDSFCNSLSQSVINR